MRSSRGLSSACRVGFTASSHSSMSLRPVAGATRPSPALATPIANEQISRDSPSPVLPSIVGTPAPVSTGQTLLPTIGTTPPSTGSYP